MITASAIPIAMVTPERRARIIMRPVHAVRSEYRNGLFIEARVQRI